MKIFSQGLEDVLEPQNDDDNADILQVVQCFVWSNTLSNLRSKLLTDDVIILIWAIFGLERNS